MAEDKKPMFPGACPGRIKELDTFTDLGMASDEFLDHLDKCPGCSAAADAVLRQEGEAIQEFVRSLRESDDGGDDQSLRERKPSFIGRLLRFLFGR